MSVHGKKFDGKQERRKEIAQIAMMHPRTFVAQTTCAHVNHFYKSVIDAMEFDGPAIVVCFTTCQPEHGVADNMATDQARLSVDSRAFPLLIYDPRKGDTIRERLSLQGNPAVNDDWWKNPKTGEIVDFIDFARSEGRFAKHFDKDGNPSQTLLEARQDRLENWHILQELAGLRGGKKTESPKAADKPAPGVARPESAKGVATAPVAAKNGNGHGELPTGYSVGARVLYKDVQGWVRGTIASISPVILSLEDDTEIEVPHQVLKAAIAEGLVIQE
jgi:hypothetical protein